VQKLLVAVTPVGMHSSRVHNPLHLRIQAKKASTAGGKSENIINHSRHEIIGPLQQGTEQGKAGQTLTMWQRLQVQQDGDFSPSRARFLLTAVPTCLTSTQLFLSRAEEAKVAPR
jgi:hypothetical protein